MRRLRIEQFCDFCHQDGEREVEATHSFATGALESLTKFPPVKLVETCDLHAKIMFELIDVLAHAVPFQPEKLKVQVPPTKRAVAAMPLDPDALFTAIDDQSHLAPSARREQCPVAGCATITVRSTLAQHVWTKHVPGEMPDKPIVCPECRAEYETTSACGVHRRIAHNFDSLGEALRHVPDLVLKTSS